MSNFHPFGPWTPPSDDRSTFPDLGSMTFDSMSRRRGSGEKVHSGLGGAGLGLGIWDKCEDDERALRLSSGGSRHPVCIASRTTAPYLDIVEELHTADRADKTSLENCSIQPLLPLSHLRKIHLLIPPPAICGDQ